MAQKTFSKFCKGRKHIVHLAKNVEDYTRMGVIQKIGSKNIKGDDNLTNSCEKNFEGTGNVLKLKDTKTKRNLKL